MSPFYIVLMVAFCSNVNGVAYQCHAPIVVADTRGNEQPVGILECPVRAQAFIAQFLEEHPRWARFTPDRYRCETRNMQTARQNI